MTAPDSLYRLLLRALPADLRAEFGDDMAQLFRDQRAAAAGHPFAVMALWIASAGDVLREAISARAPLSRPRVFSWRSLMRTFSVDLRHGLRLLRRYPASSLLAVLTLALGIGANSAIFSVVDAVLLRALPYPDPDRLVMVWEKRPAEGVLTNVVSPADFLDWKKRQTAFDDIAALAESSATLTGQGEPVELGTAAVSPSFFDVLGISPALGRRFRSEEDTFGKHRVVILTHGAWLKRFGGDPAVIGRTVTLNGNPWEVVGVLPASFRFPAPSLELWVPAVLETPQQPAPRASHQMLVYGRLKQGVTIAQARDAMDRLGKQLEAEYPDTNTGHSAWVTTLREEYVGPVSTSLVALFSAVGLVLLIACVNVANLQLARAASRRREMAVRSALGASRSRLIVQSLVEHLAMAIAGGIVGLGVAWLTLRALPAVLPEQMSVVGIRDVSLDVRVLGFALAVSLVTGILIGILPALFASRPEVSDMIKSAGRGPAAVRRRARTALVIGEVALASLTLVGAGLVVRSFATILAQPLGFEATRRLTFGVSVPGVRYPTPERRRLVLEEIERQLAGIPGVVSVGAVNLLPLGGGDSRTGIGFEGRQRAEGDPPTRMHPRVVTPTYFTTMAIPVVAGRGFTAEDTPGGEPVVVLSESSVRRYYPNESPIGKRIRFGGDETWRTIVGVVGDVRHWGLTQPINPIVYWPQAQAQFGFTTFVLETSGDPLSLAAAARQRVATVDPLLPLARVRTLDDVVAASVTSQRAQTVLMGAFGVLALVLAVIGIYGVMSQLVAVRVPEIGVRMSSAPGRTTSSASCWVKASGRRSPA